MLGDSLKKQQSSTKIPSTTYDSMHPNEMRIEDRYGETSIPGTSFIRDPNSQRAYQMSRGSAVGTQSQHVNTQYSSQPYLSPQTQYSVSQVSYAHGAPPHDNYGIHQQQCCDTGFSLPVYYEEPITVREQWQRPLSARVAEQDWRYVKTEDQGGIVRTVPRNQFLVNTASGGWERHYDAKRSVAPVTTPKRAKKTCCTPLLFALLGLLALAALIFGLVSLLKSHGDSKQPEISDGKQPGVVLTGPENVQPVPGNQIEEFPAIPIPVPETPILPITPVIPTTRPTTVGTPPSAAAPSSSVQTTQPLNLPGETLVTTQTAVSVNYPQGQYNPNINEEGIGSGSSGSYGSGSSSSTSVNPNNDYQVVGGSNAGSVMGAGAGSSSSLSSSSMTSSYPGTGNSGWNDYQIPPGYKLQGGVLVKNHHLVRNKNLESQSSEKLTEKI